MPFDDPRNFLEYLEERNDLLRISDEVDPKYEISAYIRKTSDQEGPALLFENVKGHDTSVVGGIFACRRRLLMALEADSKTSTNSSTTEWATPSPLGWSRQVPAKK